MRLRVSTSIVFMGVDFDVDGMYTPEEPQVNYYPDGSGHPGFPATFEVISISYDGNDVTDLMEDLGFKEEIEQICLEDM